MMKLHEEWRLILKKAWSLRLMALSFIFQGFELVLPLFVESFPRGIFAALSLLALAGGIWARLIAQQRMRNGS
jgi:hypothetical protein